MKEKPFIENLLIWRGLPNLIIIIGMVISFIFFLATISSKLMEIQQQHQKMIDNIENIERHLIEK